jgi:hypothetical protein
MKQLKVTLLLSVFVVAFNIHTFAQNILPEVTVVSTNYKYLKSVADQTVAEPVKILERRAAAYDVKSSDFYEDEYDNYFISFYIPQGEILAAYDNNGKILRTVEKFKNIALPVPVRQSVAQRFPQWTISKDAYLVNYYNVEGASKVYKMLLQNGSKRIRVKTNEKGEFME